MTPQVDPTVLVQHLDALAQAVQRVAEDLRSGLANLGAGEPHSGVSQPSMASHGPLLDAQGLAALLGINTRTLRRWRHEGRVPRPLRGKGPLRWSRVAVEGWLEERAS